MFEGFEKIVFVLFHIFLYGILFIVQDPPIYKEREKPFLRISPVSLFKGQLNNHYDN
jgi:hypothetical protein